MLVYDQNLPGTPKVRITRPARTKSSADIPLDRPSTT